MAETGRRPLVWIGDKPVYNKDRVQDANGVFVAMAHADGYLMVRRPGCAPLVKSVREWEQLLLLNGVPK